MAEASQNPLVSTARASDNSSTVQLHPLVLLTISDCITRHTLRQQKGPVVGAIIGQQNGQEITMEVAFQAKLMANDAGETVLDAEWFAKRLEDFKDVHKQPPLDLVGWFTLGPRSGPQPHILPIHSHISEFYTESPLLVLFHPEDAFSEATAAGKLPLTLYEPISENVISDPNDKAMDIDGAVQARSTRFKELVYTIETGEAEMISVDFVARGGGNATAVEGTTAPKAGPSKVDEAAGKKSSRGKQKEKKDDKEKDAPIEESLVMTAEDDEILSSLTAKMNAIRMLSRRIQLLRTYLDTLPPSYLSDPSLPLAPTVDAQNQLPLNHSILRSISATLSRINILAPPDADAFTLESQQEASDVQLVNLLSSITNSVSVAKELGRKSHIVEHAKSQGKNRMGMMGGYGGDVSGGGAYFNTVMGGSGGSGAACPTKQGIIMGIVPPWRHADEDPLGAVVIGWYVHVVSIAILVFIWPIFIILVPIMVPLCIIGIPIHFFAWLYRTILDHGIRGPPREIHEFMQWVRRDLRDAWLDFCDACRELMDFLR